MELLLLLLVVVVVRHYHHHCHRLRHRNTMYVVCIRPVIKRQPTCVHRASADTANKQVLWSIFSKGFVQGTCARVSRQARIFTHNIRVGRLTDEVPLDDDTTIPVVRHCHFHCVNP